MTENNESNGNPPTAFSPRAATSSPFIPSLPLSLSLSLPPSPGRSSARCVRTIGGSLYLPPCSFSSILALLHWLLYLPFHCPLFHYFRRIPVSPFRPGKGCEFSPPFIYGAVITDVLTEFKRHKWPAMISLVYEMLASPLPLPFLLLFLLCCLSVPLRHTRCSDKARSPAGNIANARSTVPTSKKIFCNIAYVWGVGECRTRGCLREGTLKQALVLRRFDVCFRRWLIKKEQSLEIYVFLNEK